MAKTLGADRTTPERVVRRVEAHENRVAERQLGLVSAMLREQEARIAEITQMQVQAAATLIEEKMVRHTETIVAALADAAGSVTASTTAALSGARAGIESHVSDKIVAMAADINKQSAQASDDVKASFDKRAGVTDAKFVEGTQGIKDYMTTQLTANLKQFSDTVTQSAQTTNDKISETPAIIAKMLNTMEVSVLARLLGLIDTRLKAIEAQIGGYAGPEQAAQDLSQWKTIAAKVLTEATELVQIAGAAVAEVSKTTDPKTADEYRFLATHSYQLALSRANEVAGIATREAGQAYDTKANDEADTLDKQATGLIQQVQTGLAALHRLDGQQP